MAMSKLRPSTPLRCCNKILRGLCINECPQALMNWSNSVKMSRSKLCESLINTYRKHLHIIAKGGSLWWSITRYTYFPTCFLKVSLLYEKKWNLVFVITWGEDHTIVIWTLKNKDSIEAGCTFFFPLTSKWCHTASVETLIPCSFIHLR